MKNKRWQNRSHQEATSNVLFLLEEKRLIPVGDPDGYKLSSDGKSFIAVNNPEKVLALPDAYRLHLETTIGTIAVLDAWLPLRIFLERKEAELWAKSNRDIFVYGYRIMPVSAEGVIVSVINKYESVADHFPGRSSYL